jgi:hypothetical protein
MDVERDGELSDELIAGEMHANGSSFCCENFQT